MNDNIESFKAELKQAIESEGVTSASIAIMAKKYGLQDDGFMYDMEGCNNLFFLWDITQEALDAVFEVLKSEKNYDIKQCGALEFLLIGGCDGVRIPNYPWAKRFQSYKSPHIYPLYIYKRRNGAK